ncbi:hypothetical protein TI05_03155 [Achromatium sp. WMS3]|nr:hypothetical protein TI05_03155 [Achromatium sp. WMS3]
MLSHYQNTVPSNKNKKFSNKMKIPNILYIFLLSILIGRINLAQSNEIPNLDTQISQIRSMNSAEQQSVGCMVGAASAMALAYTIGPSEVIMLMSGGAIIPSSASVLFTSLVATMASLGCIGGAIVTPLAVWSWDEIFASPPIITPKPSKTSIDSKRESMPSNKSYVFEQGIGCIAAGGAAAILASLIGANETLMVTAGGMLIPSASSTLWLGIMSTLVAGTCSMGAVATPGIIWAYEQSNKLQGSGLISDAKSSELPTTRLESANISKPAIITNNLLTQPSPEIIKTPQIEIPKNIDTKTTTENVTQQPLEKTIVQPKKQAKIKTPKPINLTKTMPNVNITPATPDTIKNSKNSPAPLAPPSISLIGIVR